MILAALEGWAVARKLSKVGFGGEEEAVVAVERTQEGKKGGRGVAAERGATRFEI